MNLEESHSMASCIWWRRGDHHNEDKQQQCLPSIATNAYYYYIEILLQVQIHCYKEKTIVLSVVLV